MSDQEFYKEKTVVHHNPDAVSGRPHDHIYEKREKVREHYDGRVEHVYYGDDFGERRRDWRKRSLVRSEMLTFRRGVLILLDIIEALLVIEFFIRLFGVLPVNFFVNLVNALTYPLIAPFGNITTFVPPYFLINWSIILAILIYGAIAMVVITLFEGGIRSAYRRRY